MKDKTITKSRTQYRIIILGPQNREGLLKVHKSTYLKAKTITTEVNKLGTSGFPETA